MWQQGQVFKLKAKGVDGPPLWAYRYRLEGRGSSRPRHHVGSRQAAEALVRTAPLVSRWIERLLAAHDPPLTVAQYLALQAIDEGEIVGAELARRAAVSPAAVSQLLAALEQGDLNPRPTEPPVTVFETSSQS